ncbi:hypothetical protein [Kitasatospora sp. NPDC007106]|uniref:hypothetical protein n=1 Tax=Kitasatospora sp. NPDC007106 TaxID=3156914 RepID=UPI003401B3D3
MRGGGTVDPLLKLPAGCILAVAAAKIAWHWLGVDVRGWICDHPWWTELIAGPALILLLVLSAGGAPGAYRDGPPVFDDGDGRPC